MKYIKSKISPTTIAIENAQTNIRLIVKNAFFNYEPTSITERKLQKEIGKTIKEISIPRLRRDTYYSLWQFATVQKQIWKSIGLTPLAILYLGKMASKDFKTIIPPTSSERAVVRELEALGTATTSTARADITSEREIERVSAVDIGDRAEETLKYPTRDKGIPLKKFYGDVWKERVKPTIERLSREKALDLNDLRGRNSLRNLAEMEERYKDHLDNIDDLKRKGAKIVMCSAHEDCSERCYPWQKQRFFSLDGSYGEIDGHAYIPLEVATDVWYTTKAGRRYKNGLLGFNCRHYLEEYRKELIPTVSEKKRAIEYGITKKQRQLERAVREKTVEASELKGIDEVGYRRAKAEARRLTEEYERFSKRHKRAFYPLRLKV